MNGPNHSFLIIKYVNAILCSVVRKYCVEQLRLLLLVVVVVVVLLLLLLLLSFLFR